MTWSIAKEAELAKKSRAKMMRTHPYLYPEYLEMVYAKNALERAKAAYKAAKQKYDEARKD